MEITKSVVKWMLLPKALPSNTHYKNPRTWMGAPTWDVIRKEVYKRANYRCEICKGQGKKHPVEAHELWVFNLETKEQILIRFIALCPFCHRLQHMGLAGIHVKNKKLNGVAFAKHYNELTHSKFTFDEIYEVGMTIYEKLNRITYKIVLDRNEEPLLKLWQDN